MKYHIHNLGIVTLCFLFIVFSARLTRGQSLLQSRQQSIEVQSDGKVIMRDKVVLRASLIPDQCNSSAAVDNGVRYPGIEVTISAQERGGYCTLESVRTYRTLNLYASVVNQGNNGKIEITGDDFTLIVFPPNPPALLPLRKNPGDREEQIFSIAVPILEDYGPKQYATTMGSKVTWNLPGREQPTLSVKGSLASRDICKRRDDQNKPTLDSIAEAEKALDDYKNDIENAAREFDVDPALLAGAIFSEWSRNMSPGELYSEVPFARMGVDMSLGLGQMLVSTAKRVEDTGVINPSKNRSERIDRLINPTENARYMAAYYKHLQKLFPGLKNDIPSLIHLYNEGEFPDNDPSKGLKPIVGPVLYSCFAADAMNRLPRFREMFKGKPRPRPR